MKPEEIPSHDTAVDTAFDTTLNQYYCSEAEPDDDGFCQRVMAVLPQRRVVRHVHWVEWLLRAQWTALSLAAVGVAALMPAGDGPVDAAHTAAAYALIGLLMFWSIPSRWSRGLELP